MRNKLYILSGITGFFVLWGLIVNFYLPEGSIQADYLTDTYGVIALLAAYFGIKVSKDWGGMSSYVGKSLIFFSLGLTMQFLGNLSYTLIYYLTNIENPYPAFGEIFYIVSVPIYIIAIWYLGKASGIEYKLQTKAGKLYAILVPLFLLLITYFIFIHDKLDASAPFINRFLDIYYPLGQTLFVSVAVVTVILTSHTLGGIMRTRVLFILGALIFQFFADGIFLYQSRNDLWMPGGISDLLFILSYYLLGVGMVMYESAASRIAKPTP